MSDGIPSATPVPVIPKAPAIPPPPPPPPPAAPPPPPPGNFVGKNVNGQKPNAKTKRLVWNKIPEVQITDAETIWSPKIKSENRLSVDINTIHELFSIKPTSAKVRSPSPRGRKPKFSNNDTSDQKTGPITLLDTKQSMNMNIFLRQFKRPVHEVVSAIEGCDTSLLSADKLRTICKLLPGKDDIKKLQEYKGELSQLDDADRFILGIIKVPSYKLRIECAILRDEYTPAVKEIEESFDTLQNAMTEIRNCVALPSILHLVLQAGNYLNQGASYGNAAGFRLHSLKSLTDTKANHPGITMMHYVAMELEKQDDLMMNWTEQLPSLSAASRISFPMVREELAVLGKKIQTLKDCVNRDKDEDLKQKMSTFMEMADCSLGSLLDKGRMVEKSSKDLALYLCEKPSQFSLEDCFNTVDDFRNKFNQAAKENARKEKLKQKRERNRNLSSQSFTALSSATNLKVSDLEHSMDDLRSGARSKRRNTVEIPRRRGHSPKLGRPFSEPVKSSTQDSLVEENNDKKQSNINSRTDLNVKQVTVTTLEPIQRYESNVTSSQERETTSYVTENSTKQLDPIVSRSNSDETQNIEERSSRRRYRSLRSIDAHDESRERRDYRGSTNSLNSNENIKDYANDVPTTPTEIKTDLNMEFLSPRERFKMRHSGRKVRTDLGLAEDSYVTRTGEILPMSSARSRFKRFEEAENGDNRKGRNDDLRERIRKYKEKNALESGARTDASDGDIVTPTRSRPSSDGSVTRLSRIFETRSVSYSGDTENRRRDEMVTEKSQSLDLKLEDVTLEDDAGSSVFSPMRIRTPTQPRISSELFSLAENNKSSENINNASLDHKEQDNSNDAVVAVSPPSDIKIEINNNVEKPTGDDNQKLDPTISQNLNSVPSILITPQSAEKPTIMLDSQIKDKSVSLLHIDGSNSEPTSASSTPINTETKNKTISINSTDESATVLDKNELEKNSETETDAKPVLSEVNTTGQVDASEIPDKNVKALKSGVSEVLNNFNKDDVSNDVIAVEENIQAEDAFSLLAETQLENAGEGEINSSMTLESPTGRIAEETDNTINDLKEDLRRMNAKLKSKHSPVQSVSSARKPTTTVKQSVLNKPTRTNSSTRSKPWEIRKTTPPSKPNKVPAKTENRTRSVSENQKPATKSKETVKPPQRTTTTGPTKKSETTKRSTDTKRVSGDKQENDPKSSPVTTPTSSKTPVTRSASTVRRNTPLRRSGLESSVVPPSSFRNRNSTMRNSTNSLHTIGRKPTYNAGDTSTLPRSGKKATPCVVASSSSTLPRAGRKTTTPVGPNTHTNTTSKRLSTETNVAGEKSTVASQGGANMPNTTKRSPTETPVNVGSNTLPRSRTQKSTTPSASLRNNKPKTTQSFRVPSVRPRSIASASELPVERISKRHDAEKSTNVPVKSPSYTIQRVAISKPSPVRIEYLPQAKVLNSNRAVAKVNASDPNQKPQKRTTPITSNTTPRSSRPKSTRTPPEEPDLGETPKASDARSEKTSHPTNNKTNVKAVVSSNKTPSKSTTASRPTKSPAVGSKPSSNVGTKNGATRGPKALNTPSPSSPGVASKQTRPSSRKSEPIPTQNSSNVKGKTSVFQRLATSVRGSPIVARKNTKAASVDSEGQKDVGAKKKSTPTKANPTNSDSRKENRDVTEEVSPQKQTTKTKKKPESVLRSSSSSSLTSKPSTVRGPPSSFKSLGDSISARSTSSLSSSSSSAAHRDVYLTKTAKLRLMKMKSNKK